MLPVGVLLLIHIRYVGVLLLIHIRYVGVLLVFSLLISPDFLLQDIPGVVPVASLEENRWRGGEEESEDSLPPHQHRRGLLLLLAPSQPRQHPH